MTISISSSEQAKIGLGSRNPQKMNALEVQLPQDISVEEARLLLMVKLFETGKLSVGQAAELAVD